jgi:hypothetical protein
MVVKTTSMYISSSLTVYSHSRFPPTRALTAQTTGRHHHREPMYTTRPSYANEPFGMVILIDFHLPLLPLSRHLIPPPLPPILAQDDTHAHVEEEDEEEDFQEYARRELAFFRLPDPARILV